VDVLPEVIVVGDMLLDQYVMAETKCAAPESNALIVRQLGVNSYPGGAANVAANLVSLGHEVELYGRAAKDADGDELLRLCVRHGVGVARVLLSARGCTTVRQRFLSEHGQLLRVDREDHIPLRHLLEPAALWSRLFMAHLDAHAAVLPVITVADYGLGYCDPSVIWEGLQEAARRGCPLLIDPPRSGNWGNYASALTLFKPNLRQALNFLAALYPAADYQRKYGHLERVSHAHEDVEQDYLELCSAVINELEERRLPYRYLWITLGGAGAVLAAREALGTCVVRLPARRVEVADVTGAGDTALAVMAGHVARHGYGWDEVVKGASAANAGAAVAVSKRGTYRLTREDLERALQTTKPGDGTPPESTPTNLENESAKC